MNSSSPAHPGGQPTGPKAPVCPAPAAPAPDPADVAQLAAVEGEPGAAPPAPLSLSRRHRWLAIDTRNALENATELFELFDLVVSTLEPEKQRVAVSDALSILRSVRRLMWRLSADMRGVSGHLTGLSCEDSLGTHVAQLASLEAYGDSDEARARFLRDAIEAFTS